jgi:hypothetical protein
MQTGCGQYPTCVIIGIPHRFHREFFLAEGIYCESPQSSRSQKDPDRSFAYLWLSRENRSDSIVGRIAWVE